MSNSIVVTQKEEKVKSGNKGFKKMGIVINCLILPSIILLFWWLVTKDGLVSSAILPSIKNVGISLMSQLQSGQLIDDLSISSIRVLKGFSIASILGIALGVFMGISQKINRFFSLTFNSIRQIPMMAWIPLIILWAGIDEFSKIVIIVMSAFFPVLVNTMSGIKQVPKGYLEVGKMFKLSKWELFRRIYFPSAIPSIFVGLKLSLGLSWMLVVAAELVSSSSGIGYRINDARSLMQPEVVIVGMFSIGIIGILMDQILVKISKLITPWIVNK